MSGISDPDELKYEHQSQRNDPVLQMALMKDVVDEIEIHLRYGIPTIKGLGIVIVLLLVLIVWRIW